jgi:hypothetical protein
MIPTRTLRFAQTRQELATHFTGLTATSAPRKGTMECTDGYTEQDNVVVPP